MNLSLSAQVEAVLFWKAEPVSKKRLLDIFNVDETAIEAALRELEATLKDRGVALMRINDEVSLGTSPEVSALIEALTKEELVKDLGKAGLETLSIVLYQGPVSRAEIDYVRGVNSSFILRNLLVRGLIEKITNPQDQRSFLYKPTIELLAHLGTQKIEDTPDFEKVRAEIAAFKAKEDAENVAGVAPESQSANEEA